MSGDIRVIVTVKNAVLLRAMEAAGFDTATALAKASSVNNGTVGDYLNLKLAPFDADGNLRPSIQRMARALGCLPEDLFPAAFLRRALATNKAHRDVSSADIPALLGHDAPSIAYDPERAAVVRAALAALDVGIAALRPREQRVLKLRYGLDGENPHTLDEIAREFGLSKDRIRQIQCRAERLMRHPGRNLRALCGPLMEGEP